MTDSLTATAAPSALRLAAWVLPAVLAAAGVAIQALTFLNHDVAWVLVSSERLLNGGVFGRDIFAANPPLIWWVSALPMAAARLTGLAPVTAFLLFTLALLTLSLAAADRLLRTQLSALHRALFLGVAAFLLSLGTLRDFGQREHLTAILALPYLLLVLARLNGEKQGLAFSAIVGASAAIGFAFKPHLLAVPLLVEGFLMTQAGIRRTLQRPEFLAAAATVAAYGAAILLFARPYLFEALPAIAPVYWAFNKPDLISMAEKAVVPAALLGLTAIFLPAAKWPRGATVLGIAALGFMVAAVLQWKAYTYHFYPVYVFAVLSLVLQALAGGLVRSVALPLIGFFALLSALSLQSRLPSGEAGAEIVKMAGFVNANTPVNGRFLAFSTHPFPGFPTALHTHATWASASNSRIFLPATVRLRADPSANLAELEFATAHERAAALRDMTPLPDLVLFDVRADRHAILDLPFDFLAFYLQDPEFRALWGNYREIQGAPEGFRAYRLAAAP